MYVRLLNGRRYLFEQTQTSNQSTPATTIPLPGSAASPPSAGGTTTSMFSPPPFQNGESHDWNGSNLDDLDSYHVDDPDHLLPYEVSILLRVAVHRFDAMTPLDHVLRRYRMF